MMMRMRTVVAIIPMMMGLIVAMAMVVTTVAVPIVIIFRY